MTVEFNPLGNLEPAEKLDKPRTFRAIITWTDNEITADASIGEAMQAFANDVSDNGEFTIRTIVQMEELK